MSPNRHIRHKVNSAYRFQLFHDTRCKYSIEILIEGARCFWWPVTSERLLRGLLWLHPRLGSHWSVLALYQICLLPSVLLRDYQLRKGMEIMAGSHTLSTLPDYHLDYDKLCTILKKVYGPLSKFSLCLCLLKGSCFKCWMKFGYFPTEDL